MALKTIDTPPLSAVAQGLAQLWAIEAKGFSPDGNLLLVKATYSDSAFPAVTTRTAFWIYDLGQGKYTACVNNLIASDRPLEVGDVVISQSGGETQLVASYHDTGVSEALDPNKLALIRDSVLIQGDLVATLSGNQSDASIIALRSTADGRFIVLETAATNLVTELDTNGSKDIFVLDQLLHTVRRITTVSGAEPVVDSLLGDARIGVDGSLSVAFQSSQAFTTQDSNAADDVFVWSLAASQFASTDSGAITLVSRTTAGAVGGSNPLLNANGVLFESESSSFVSYDLNGANDVFQSAGGAVTAVSSSVNATFSQASGLAGSSNDGLRVALVSSTPDVAGGIKQLLVINSATHESVVVSRAADGKLADDDVISPVLSASGSVVAFSSQAINLSGSAPDGLMHLYFQNFNASNVNGAPSITSGATASVAENTAISTVVYTATASDPDANDTKTWSLTGTDASLLSIDSSGQVTLKAAANYEVKSSYSFSVVDTDAGGLTGSQAVVLSVTNVNEAPSGLIRLTGSPVQGQTLVVVSSLGDADGLGTLNFRWRAGGKDITGATSSNFLLTAAQVGKKITVLVGYIDGGGTTESVSATTTSSVSDISSSSPTQIAALGASQLNAMTTAQWGSLTTVQVAAISTLPLSALTTARLNALTTRQFTALTTTQIAALTSAQVVALESADFGVLSAAQMGALTLAGMAALKTAQLAALSPTQLSGLTSAQVAALSVLQLNALSSTNWAKLNAVQVAAISTPQLQALTTARLNALTTAQFAALTADQISALMPAQVAALESADFRVLSAAQISALTPADIAALKTAQLAGLSSIQLPGLTNAQMAALSVLQINALSSANWAKLNADQVAAISTLQLPALTTARLNLLTTAQFMALTPDQMAALTTAQVVKLESADFAVLSAAQIGAFTPDDMAALKTAQLAALSSTQLAGLTNAQMAALSVVQLNALSSANWVSLYAVQVAAISTLQLPALSAARLNALTTMQFEALTTDQIGALTTAQFKALTTAKISALTISQVAAIENADFAVLSAAQIGAFMPSAIAALTTLQMSSLSTARLNALTTAQFKALTTTQIAALATAQVVALESADFAVLSAGQVAAFTPAGVAALSTAQVARLGTSQVGALTTSQVAALSVNQLSALSSAQWIKLGGSQVAALAAPQLAALSTARLNALTTAQFTALTTTQIAALTPAQVVALESADFAVLSSTQIGALTPADMAVLKTAKLAALSSTQLVGVTNVQIAALSVVQLNALSSANWVSLTPVQVAALTTLQLPALTAARLNLLTTAQFTALTSSQIAALTTAQVAKLETADLAALGTTQIRAFTTAEIQALTTKQISSLSTSQLFAFTAAQVSALTPAQSKIVKTKTGGLVTPLMLDLDGNGVQTLGLSAGVQFDVANLGHAAATGWVAPADGLLVLDRNHNGVIDDGGELFGSGTLLSDGSHAADGFAALAVLDGNGDSVIDSRDAIFTSLAVWVDANSDGLSQAAELKQLDALGISALRLSATTTLSLDNGNVIGLTSSYDSTDGASHELVDVWLASAQQVDASATHPASLEGRVSDMTQALGRCNEMLQLLGSTEGTNSASLQRNWVDRTVEQLSAWAEETSILHGVSPMLAAMPPALFWHSDLTEAPASSGSEVMALQFGHRPGR